jgi:ligand-binding sensor domain-containing protein
MAARGRAPGALLLGILLTCSCAFALNPALDVSQYAHTAWRYRDGFAKGEIYGITQTADGYLWLGTSFGLFRFDGVRTTPWEPPPTMPLPSSDIFHLVAARDGTLWIGTVNGLASWKDDKLTNYPELAGFQILRLLEDRVGSLWVGAYGLPYGKLCEIRNGGVRCHTEIGGLGHGAFGFHEDRKGNLWVGLATGVWRWKPGPPQFYSVTGEEGSGIQGMADGEDGALLISTTGGVRQLVGGKLQMAYPFAPSMRRVGANRLLRDRDGGLWGGTLGGGIVHVHQGRTDLFSQADGLTGDRVLHLFEDREGSIWVATASGLDRFREFPVATSATKQGVPTLSAVLAARDGTIWLSAPDGLSRLSTGQVAFYSDGGGPARAGVPNIRGTGVPDHVQSLFQDSRGRIWVSAAKGVGYLENDRFVLTNAPGGNTNALTEDTAGNLWISNQNEGLVRLSPDREVQRIPWAALGGRGPAPLLAADPAQGGLWLGFVQGGIAYVRDGQTRISYSANEGLAPGRIWQLRFDDERALWIATDGGLSRWKDGRIATMTSKSGLPCDGVQWMIEDNAHSIWLKMPCGLARVARSEWDAWVAASDKTGHTMHPAVFDSSDGVTLGAQTGTYTPRVAKSADGKLWFVESDGLSMIDPSHLAFNKLPPPVHIEQVTADRKMYGAEAKLRLPPLVRDVQIDYTALSFVAPEKIRFRFKLEGRDRDWHEVGNRRQAFYDDLPPRRYRFRVMAANNSGVWNEAGASLDFSVDPAYYQTGWFRASVAVAILIMLAAAYQLRLRYLKQQFHLRMEERVGERTRIARDLHDTLLQSFQGVLLKLQAVTYLYPDRADEAPKTLAGVIEEARQAITEGRDAVQGLRSSTVIANDLAQAIGQLGEQLIADQKG